MIKRSFRATVASSIITVVEDAPSGGNPAYNHDVVAAQTKPGDTLTLSNGVEVVSSGGGRVGLSQGVDATSQVVALAQVPGPVQLKFSSAGCPDVLVNCDVSGI